MVEVKRTESDNGQVKYIVSSPKMKANLSVQKAPNGFVLYEVVTDVGRLPQVLSGGYTTPDKALAAVKEYLRTYTESQAVQRDNKTKIREKARDAKAAAKSNSTEHLRQGSAD